MVFFCVDVRNYPFSMSNFVYSIAFPVGWSETWLRGFPHLFTVVNFLGAVTESDFSCVVEYIGDDF